MSLAAKLLNAFLSPFSGEPLKQFQSSNINIVPSLKNGTQNSETSLAES